MEYQIIADGACDLYGENADKIGVQIVPFYVAFEENVYKKEGAEIEVRHFYKEMVENPTVFPKTSMPSVQDYVDVFTPIVKAGEGVLCICITQSSAALIIQRSMPEICSWKIIRMQRLK